MATLTIRQLDEESKMKLRIRAARHGRSIEEEAREILRDSLDTPEEPQENLAEIIRKRFAPYGGVEIELPQRRPMRPPPDFSE